MSTRATYLFEADLSNCRPAGSSANNWRRAPNNEEEAPMSNIDNLTFGELKQIAAMFSPQQSAVPDGLGAMIGKKCIVRTYSAGVWFGEIEQKAGNEVIVKNARRMWRWKAAESISLSAVALHGINSSQSKIAEAVPQVWLEAIELIPCTDVAISNIEGSPNVQAE